ncbi:MAG: hypothetical protein ABSD73_07675 [Candidatus Bathyarchaeia archaeon]
MFKKDFDEVTRKAVDEGFSATGESVEQWVHFHAESSFEECTIAADNCFLQRNRTKTTAELTE